MNRHILQTEQKALEINLTENIYGTFAEIGAGQEVARNFFQAGAAVGTIAKTMSAYDKTYSDAIYGFEDSGRYVCEARLYKMLDHEYSLMEERLQVEMPNTNFFVFADTVAAINFDKTIKGNGWLGVRFQLNSNSEPNDIVIHARMLDMDNRLQQEAIGVLGVNLIYGCFFYRDNMEYLVQSLKDGLKGRIMVDMIRLSGPNFEEVDNRLLSLMLVKFGLSDVAMFDSSGKSIHASEFLYKKSLMVVRGHYRPPTLVTLDAFKSSFKQFKNETDNDPERSYLISEMTLEYLKTNGEIEYKDFLDRAELLCALGQTVAVTNCSNHQKLINYLSEYKIKRLGLVIGVRELLEIINEKYYQNMDGRLLVAFGELFTRNIKIYAYPALQAGSHELMNAKNLPVPEGIKFLYKYLLDSNHIVKVEDYNADLLHIFPDKAFDEITSGESTWENKLPAKLRDLIKEKGLFNYPKKEMKFET
jgi:hypothetical protein